jgi:hypothetical protein
MRAPSNRALVPRRRRRLALVPGGLLAGLAGLVALAGCTDSEVGGPEGSTAGVSVEQFCDDYQELDDRFSDPTSEATPQEIGDALAQIEAPEQIADEMAAWAEGIPAAEDLDPADPADAETIAGLQAAGTAIQQFRDTECGVAGGAGGSGA